MRRQPVIITFNNAGLRSNINCSLCKNCHRGDGIGCCTYSPTFMPIDIGYFINIGKQSLVEELLGEPEAKVLDGEIAVNTRPDKKSSSGQRCFFHSEAGCGLKIEERDTICRQYLCSDLKLWSRPQASTWKQFWELLTDFEQEFNQAALADMKERGLSLKKNPQSVFSYLREKYQSWQKQFTQAASEYPADSHSIVYTIIIKPIIKL